MPRSTLTPAPVSDPPPWLRQPSRNADPETSHIAGRKIQTSGKLTKQAQETLVALVRFNWSAKKPATSAELARNDQRLRYQYARRLPDLEHMGLVVRLASKRACDVTGSLSFPWTVTERGMTEFRRLRAERRMGGSNVSTR